MEARAGSIQAMPPNMGPCERAEKGQHYRNTGGKMTSVREDGTRGTCWSDGGECGRRAVEILIEVGPEASV